MVYIRTEDGEEKKLACLKCKKGHRSSKCFHKNRELFEIKKKGRPVSQCENCRQARKTKQIHVKCVCETNKPHTDSKQPMLSDHMFRHDETFNTATLPTSKKKARRTSSTTTAIGLCPNCMLATIYCTCNPSQSTPTIMANNYSSGSSDGSVTPPVASRVTDAPPIKLDRASVELTTVKSSTSMTSPMAVDSILNNTNIAPLSRLTIPIHDPTDDIDSDTPIYKSQENTIPDKMAVLGALTDKSSEELMNQIYSEFNGQSPSPSLTSSPLLREQDEQLVQLSKED